MFSEETKKMFETITKKQVFIFSFFVGCKSSCKDKMNYFFG